MPAFLNDLLQTKHFIDFDPWVTQRFPLGHPEFSTGSPKVFHWVTQAFPGSCNSCLPTTTSQPSAERSHPRNTKPRLFSRGTTLRYCVSKPLYAFCSLLATPKISGTSDEVNLKTTESIPHLRTNLFGRL